MSEAIVPKELMDKAEMVFSLGMRGTSIKFIYVKVGDEMQCYGQSGGSQPVLLGTITSTEATAGTWANPPPANGG